MSTGLELIPLLIAIGAAVGARRTPSRVSAPEAYALATRMRDPEMLHAVMRQHDPSCAWQGDTLVGTVHGVPLNLYLPAQGAAFEALMPNGVPVAAAQEAIVRLDAGYAGLVQHAVRARVLQEASSAGLSVEHERVDDDGTVVLTLQVREGP
jgi:hypothetical protein